MSQLRAFILILMIMLTGCQSEMNFNYPMPSPTTEGLLIGAASGAAIGAIGGTSGSIPAGMVVGGILGAAIGHQFERHATLIQQLRQQGVQVFRVGDKVDIILPADKVFYPYSPRLNPNFYPVLIKVAFLLRGVNKTLVQVSAHTDNTQCCPRALALTRAQAEAVTSYLWEQEVDARVMYGTGFGFNCPIASNQTEKGRATNRRVEIQFWRIPRSDPM